MLVRIDGDKYEIPERPHRLRRMEYDSRRRVHIEKEYQFNLPSVEVKVLTWETETPQWSVKDDGSLPEPPNLVNDQIRHINEFVGPQGFGRPGHSEHWTSKVEYEDRIRLEIKERGLRHKAKGFNYSEKGEDMSHLVTGTRVRVLSPSGEDQSTYATVVEVEEPLPTRHVLLCMDVPDRDYQDCSYICGEDHGLIIHQNRLRNVRLDRRKSSTYKGIPKHIGMFVPEPFKFQNKKFSREDLGRVVSRNDQHVTLEWLNVPGLKHDPFYVPQEQVRWCRFNPKTYKIQQAWPTTYAPFVQGDILVYWNDKAHQVSGAVERHAVTRGVILKHVGDGERGLIKATIVAGMDPELLGQTIQVRKQDVCKFEQPFIDRGQEVEVVAEVMFKKRDIRGRRGKVVLATDIDGDVGIQFSEDLGAGSLDGAGKEGCCLYVPAKAVEEVSE